MTDGWQELSPWHLKKSDLPRVTIRAAVMGKHKSPIVYIGINRPLVDEMKWPMTGRQLARVDFGTGSNAGRLRIAPSEKGRFRLAVTGVRGNKAGVRLVLRIPGQPPATSRPQIIDHAVESDSLILFIPKDWADVVQVQPYSKTSAPVTAPRQRADATERTTIVSVKPDVLEMLKGAEPMRQLVCTGKNYEFRGDDDPAPVPIVGDVPPEPQKVRLIKREHLSIVRPLKTGGNGYKPGPMLDLGPDQCRFTIEGATMCGAETVKDKSYCAGHLAVCYPAYGRFREAAE